MAVTPSQLASLCDAMLEFHMDQKAPFRRAVDDHLAIAQAIREGMPAVWNPGPVIHKWCKEMMWIQTYQPWRFEQANRQWLANEMKMRAARRQLDYHEGEIQKWKALKG